MFVTMCSRNLHVHGYTLASFTYLGQPGFWLQLSYYITWLQLLVVPPYVISNYL
jgi:hypothetical protein